MSNPSRYGFQFRSSGCPALWDLFGKITFGANGAPTLTELNSIGITSISRSSAGKYVIVLNNGYSALKGVYGTFVASGGAAAPDVVVDTDDVTNASITILTQAGGVNTDPANGEILLLDIVVKNSSVTAG